jgi:ApbE superfamily uncharacterized protein (UPF0280 family)
MKTTNKVSAKIKSAFIVTLIASSIIMAGSASAEKGKNMKNKTLICHIDENGSDEIIVNNTDITLHMSHGDNIGGCGQDGTPPTPPSDDDFIMPF